MLSLNGVHWKHFSSGEKSARVSDLQTTNNGLWIAAKLLVPTVYQADDGGSSNARSPHKIGTFLWEYALFENIILPSKLDGGPLKALCKCVKFIQNQEIREELRTTMRWTVCRYIRTPNLLSTQPLYRRRSGGSHTIHRMHCGSANLRKNLTAFEIYTISKMGSKTLNNNRRICKLMCAPCNCSGGRQTAPNIRIL